MISRDQRSPSISSEMLTGQPDRGCDLDLPGTSGMVTSFTFILQVISRRKLRSSCATADERARNPRLRGRRSASQEQIAGDEKEEDNGDHTIRREESGIELG